MRIMQQDYMSLRRSGSSCYIWLEFWRAGPVNHTPHLWMFCLFQRLQNSLNGKNFNSLEDCKRHLEQFSAQKDKKFWEDGTMKLPEKWQKAVEQYGLLKFLVKMTDLFLTWKLKELSSQPNSSQGLNLHPVHWKLGALTTGPLREVPLNIILIWKSQHKKGIQEF